MAQSLTDILKNQTYAIIGINSGELTLFDLLICKRKGSKVEISQMHYKLTQEDLLKQVSSKMKVLLNIQGKSVVSKILGAHENVRKDFFLNKVSIDEFYSYVYSTEKANNTSVIRKDTFKGIIERLLPLKIHPIDYSIGPFVGALIMPLVKEKKVQVDSYLFYSENDITIVELNDENSVGSQIIEIDGTKFSPSVLPLFGTLINYLFPSERILYDVTVFEDNKKEDRYKKWFSYGVIAMIILSFTGLLTSYLLLDYYNNEYVRYESELYLKKENYNQLIELEKWWNQQQIIMEESGQLNDKFFSYYIYELGSSTPEDITLNSLKINPLIKGIKNKEKVDKELQVIEISGIAEHSKAVSLWLELLQKKSWVQKIEILNVGLDKGKKSEFIFRIIYK